MAKQTKRQMYAISADGVGLIAGTLSYSRRDAMSHFFGGAIDSEEWERLKRSGYRTVRAVVEVVGSFGTRRVTKRA